MPQPVVAKPPLFCPTLPIPNRHPRPLDVDDAPEKAAAVPAAQVPDEQLRPRRAGRLADWLSGAMRRAAATAYGRAQPRVTSQPRVAGKYSLNCALHFCTIHCDGPLQERPPCRETLTYHININQVVSSDPSDKTIKWFPIF